jgi:hypothetical protein
MSRILIISAWYAPLLNPRAHRWTALAEHWASEGHAVTVLSSRCGAEPLQATRNGVQLRRTGYDALHAAVLARLGRPAARGQVGGVATGGSWAMRTLLGLYRSTWKNLHFPDDACVWYWPARRELHKLLKNNHFDTIVTVSMPLTGHLLGLYAKRLAPGLRWLADFGDPALHAELSWGQRQLHGQRMAGLERRVLREASAVSVTTEVLRQRYQALVPQTPVACIPPLLHPPSPPMPKANTAPGGPIRLCFAGTFFREIRPPEALLDLLWRLQRDSPMLRERLQAHFFGEVFPDFLPALRQQKSITLHGLVPRETLRAQMPQMDILLNVGNRSAEQVPSKLAEYAASGKPIVHLSYVENDPFEAFFDGWAGFLSLKVGEKGAVSAEEVGRCRRWLERYAEGGGVPPWPERAEKLRQMSLPVIAEAYARLLWASGEAGAAIDGQAG